MQVLVDDGTRIGVRVDGAGDAAIVLLHGFPLTRDIWEAQAQALARKHRAILPDLRGMGTSQRARRSVSDGNARGRRGSLLDALGVERAAVVGHSLGGYVALAFARMFSERLTGLGLVCSRLAADTSQQARERGELADRVEKRGTIEPAIDAYLPRLFAPQTPAERPAVVDRAYEIARRNSPHGAAAILRGMAMRAAADDIAPEIGVPALVVAGACDAVGSLEEARENARAFPRGRLVVCASSGHLPMLEEPERVSLALEEFLEAAVT